jgi:endoglucanase
VAYTGVTRLSKAGADKTEDAYKSNYSGTDVYELDFSDLRVPGEYVVAVPGVGCSLPFRLGEDVWEDAFTVSARGFYHQRSGIELGPPYTTFRRPRPFHPADGVTVYASTCPLMNSGNGINYLGTDKGNFGNLVKGKTDETVPKAWGGYMDAGDWDRRIQHLIVSRYLIDLADLFPVEFGKLGLNIPESNDGLPDVVSEALFNLDCYRRMQTAEGGIRGGIESSEHPREGEGSWQESLTVLAYAPGVWSSHVYAGVAAQAAHWLESRNADMAATYRESALRAMGYAEKHWADLGEVKAGNDGVVDARNLAAVELYRLTGDERWHRLFLDTTVFRDPKADLFVWQKHNQPEAAWIYARMKGSQIDQAVQTNCRNAILREAENRVRSTRNAGFRWAKYEWQSPAGGAFSSPDGVSLCRAHALTGDGKYLRAAVLACQVGLGANPIDLCYTTGVGQRSPLHPLHIDSRMTDQPPPPGLTVFGPQGTTRGKGEWGQKLANEVLYPKFEEWPTLEAYWDIFWYPSMCEFTVQTPMARNAYVWGYLAAVPR